MSRVSRVILNHRTQRFRLVDDAGHTVGRVDEVGLAYGSRGWAHRGVTYNGAGSPVVVATVAAPQRRVR